jgi:hypothetical protein
MSDFCDTRTMGGTLMSDTAKLIEKLATHIEGGKSVDFGKILEIHDQLKDLHKSLRAELGDSNESVRAAREADRLIEKIILEYVASTSAALRDLGKMVVSLQLNSEIHK